MRVLVCGDRRWTDRSAIFARLCRLPGDTVIVEGCARGADQIAGEIADDLGFKHEQYPANWDMYGRAAGPIRNREMLNTKPNLVIAFHPNIKESKGTADCVKEAQRRGIPVEIIAS